MLIDNEKRIIASLYFELENNYLSANYKHGFLRTIYVIFRALTAPSLVPFNSNWTRIFDKSICFVFFQNEFNSAIRNQQATKIDEIIQVDPNKLHFLIQHLGWVKVLRELFVFWKISIEIKGWQIFLKSAHPALGWLLYVFFKKIFSDKPCLRIVSLNLIHPSSLGVAWAAYTTKTTLDYCEHAATTLLMISNSEIYRNYYVSHNHTKSLLVSSGLQAENIFLLHENKIEYQWPPFCEIETVGFCINDLDTISAIEMVTESVQLIGASLVCRVHDADQRYAFLSKLAIKNNFKIESAKNSKIEDFLSKIDLLIAGNSNVIGDALIAGKPVIYFWSGELEIYDYYGFVKFYKIKSADSRISLNTILNQVKFRKLINF